MIRDIRGRIGLILIGAIVLIASGVLLFGGGKMMRSSGPAAQMGEPPPPPWTAEQLRALLQVAEKSGDEGLRPDDYDRDALKAAIDEGLVGSTTDSLARKTALALAHDYAAGRIRHRSRFNWYIDYQGPDADDLRRQMEAARADGRLDIWLAGLLPRDPQYLALRAALAETPDGDHARRDRIRANMERWRWLPRDFGAGDELYVNLPSYRMEVRQAGQVVASYNVVIGATDMPTPVLSAMVKRVIANPSWIVPPSIVRKSNLRPGTHSRYIFTTLPDGTVRVRQKPGAGNALGKVKIELPNKMAIYFHDTPSRSLFGENMRAFSHGCVRVQHIDELAGFLTRQDPRFASALAGDATRSFPIAHPWRANIVYLTMIAKPGDAPVEIGDPYGMDARMAAALDGRQPAKGASPTDSAGDKDKTTNRKPSNGAQAGAGNLPPQ